MESYEEMNKWKGIVPGHVLRMIPAMKVGDALVIVNNGREADVLVRLPDDWMVKEPTDTTAFIAAVDGVIVGTFHDVIFTRGRDTRRHFVEMFTVGATPRGVLREAGSIPDGGFMQEQGNA